MVLVVSSIASPSLCGLQVAGRLIGWGGCVRVVVVMVVRHRRWGSVCCGIGRDLRVWDARCIGRVSWKANLDRVALANFDGAEAAGAVSNLRGGAGCHGADREVLKSPFGIYANGERLTGSVYQTRWKPTSEPSI